MKKFLTILLSLILVLFFVTGSQLHASAKSEDVRLKVLYHCPSPHNKQTANACSVTINDQADDYLLAGWRMSPTGVVYKINYTTKPKNLSKSQVYTAISNSFASWRDADQKQVFKYGGTTSVKTTKFDGTNAILWKRISNSAIAVSYVWYYPSTGQLAEADTVFNNFYKWSYTAYDGVNDCGGAVDAFDLQNIGTHEFGHWIGLDDLYSDIDRDLTMYGYADTSELKKDSLGLGDITGGNTVAP